jgi:tetratricopeptide (TPR) repeat protein
MPLRRLHGCLIALTTVLMAASATGMEAEDPFFGEALYYSYQGEYFEALQRLDAEIAQYRNVDEPQLDSLYRHIGRAEFSVGDFELQYRMHHRAGRAIQMVLEADVSDPVRNEAAYRLARIHFHKVQPADALDVLTSIRGEIPSQIADDVDFLHANVLIALGRPAEAAEVLRGLQDSEELDGFAEYNLGIALLRAQEPKDAVRQLDRAGRVSGTRKETLAIRDKANLVLGTMALESASYGLAQRALDRVRLEGPFSNRALLGAGWADASAEHYERALVPWGILVGRDTTDEAVQEVMLALPYAYGKLNVHGRAAMLYEQAARSFGAELEKLDASIQNIRGGEFLKALVREEIRHDEDWVVRLRTLPDAPETFYLVSLMASHDFQTALQNFLDLEDLRAKLVSWKRSLVSFEELTAHRRAYYEPLLPDVDQRFRKLDAQIRLRLEQRRHLARRLQQILIAPRPDLLATSSEQAMEARLDRLQEGLGGTVDDPMRQELRRRVDRLRGVIAWNMQTDYHQRLTDAHTHMRELDADVEHMTAQYDAYVRARQAATHGYVGYQPTIDGLKGRVHAALEQLNTLMARQGGALESVAIHELSARRERLVAFQNQARFAFADSYDRAVKARAEVRSNVPEAAPGSVPAKAAPQ